MAHRIAREFRRTGHRVSVITASAQERIESETDGVKVYQLHSNYPRRFRAYFSLYNPQVVPILRRTIQQVEPDVVYVHNIHQHLSYHSLKVAHDLRVPVFLTAHDVMSFAYGKLTHFIDPDDLSVSDDFDYRLSPWTSLRDYRFRYFPLRNLLIGWYLRRYVTRIISVSHALKQALEDNGIGNVQVIYNGIDPDGLRVDPAYVQQFRQRMELNGKRVVLFGGRLSQLKGGEQLLRAIGRVVSQVPDAVLLVVGHQQSYAEKMSRLAADLDIAGRVIFTGWIEGDDLKAAYAASTVVTVPSICFDSFPVVNLEAMAAAKPIVATCFGGSPEVVVDGETGYIVNPLNVEMLADRLTELLLDQGKARRMGLAGRQRLLKHFTLEHCAWQYLELLR